MRVSFVGNPSFLEKKSKEKEAKRKGKKTKGKERKGKERKKKRRKEIILLLANVLSVPLLNQVYRFGRLRKGPKINKK